MLHRLRPIVLAVLALIATVAIGAQAPSQAQLLQEGLRLLETRGDARAATRVFEQAAQGPDRGVSARAWLYLGMALEKLGRDQARREYERVVRDFSDQADIVAEARRRLAALTHNVPPSQQRPITMRRAFLESDPGNRVVRERLARRTRARIWRRARRDRPRRHGHRSARAHRRRARTRAGLARGGSPGWPRRDLRARLGRRQRARVARAGEPTGVLLRAPRGDAIANVDWPIRDQLVVQVQHSDTTASLHVVDAATHTSRQILNLAAAAGRVSLSPDGRFIVYDAPAPEGTAHDLFIVRTNGGDVTRLNRRPLRRWLACLDDAGGPDPLHQ